MGRRTPAAGSGGVRRTDAEPEWLDDTELHVWRRFQRMRTQFATALRVTMQLDSDLPLPDFEVLAVLSDAEGGELRARDLRFELQWEKSRLAHRVKALEERGLVQRSECPDDPRAPIVRMTEAGRQAIAAAAPAHVDRVRDLVFDPLTKKQQQALLEISEAIMGRLAERGLNEP
ncbi:MarR family winged helix-turn-helix transcriptional regulator [Kribbella sp. NPDC051770]|uniref:MarR family winged helix-turn-helix transcriptional regulator n=1 Tax=Kribbella sp. NPDC051770 TaxID=3155413 RepID=UPI003427016D